MKAQFIVVNCTGGRYRKRAVILSERVAVNRRVNSAGKNIIGYGVSDPVTGHSYQSMWMVFKTERAAVTWARRLIKTFGANPLGEAVLKADGLGWTIEPPRLSELRQFVRDFPTVTA